MSNDTRFWVARGVVWLIFTVDGWFLGKIMTASFEPGPEASKHVMFWFILFIIATLLNIPVYIYYRKLKAERWSQQQDKTQAQIEVETLAAYARQERLDAAKPIRLADPEKRQSTPEVDGTSSKSRI